MGRLFRLSRLSIHQNHLLAGSKIPTHLGNLRRLHVLQLSGCGFDGTIPSQLGKLVSMRVMNLSSNELRGSLPAQLGKCRISGR